MPDGDLNAKPDESGLEPQVKRSYVIDGLKYTEYKEELRYDFYYSCAYCTMSEAEAMAIRFTIDHYVPQVVGQELVNNYGNLMYCCDECNSRKGDRWPPDEARRDGFVFYRPDEHIREEHFEQSGIRLNKVTNTGHYTIEALDLNRASLRRLRELRERLAVCERFVADGVLALEGARIDRLQPSQRSQALNAIRNATKWANQLADNVDSCLRVFAKSSLIDGDTQAEERARGRREELAKIEGLYPGSWRGRAKRTS